MFKKLKNNFVMEINELTLGEIRGIADLYFTKKDVDEGKLDILVEAEFKYRKFEEYIFVPENIYKLYVDRSEKFNICKLLEYEVMNFKNAQKFSNILLENDAIYVLAQVADGVYENEYPLSKVAYETSEYFVSIDEYKWDKGERDLVITYKPTEINAYDYRQFIRTKIINEKILEIKEKILNEKILEIKEKILNEDIGLWLYNNYKKIKEEVGSFSFKTEIYTKEGVEDFAKRATASTSWFSHSWAGSEGNEVDFYTIHGNILYGKDSRDQYSENGTTGSPVYEIKETDFCMEDMIIFFRRDYDYNGYNRRDAPPEIDIEYTLVIYEGLLVMA